MTNMEIEGWFLREVLPLEVVLTRFLRRRWRNEADVADLRQEVYVRLCHAARSGPPKQIKPFMFTVARNLVVDLARRAPEMQSKVEEDEGQALLMDAITPDYEAIVREDLLILHRAIEQLPSRCREVVRLRRLIGLSQRETASAMGITEHTVERQMVKGMRRLSDALIANE